MTEEVAFFFLLVAGLAKVSFALSCLSELRCKCSYVNNMLTADCSYLHLTKPPNFTKDVRRIDLSHNHLFEIPINILLEIVFLNLKGNNIRYPQKSTLAQYKHMKQLYINGNCLWEELKIWPSRIFENPTKLKFLTMRDNCPGIDEIHRQNKSNAQICFFEKILFQPRTFCDEFRHGNYQFVLPMKILS